MIGPDRDVGVVVVGLGFIAGAHVAAIEGVSGVTLVGIVDADAGRAAAFSHGHGGVAYTTDLNQALGWPGVDAVIICTPNSTHVTIGLEAAKAGKHILVEKPLATTVSDAVALQQACDAAGAVLMAAHTHRHYDYGRSVKECLRSGAIGEPDFARLAILGSWIWPDWNGWMIDPVKSGGHALHNGVHLLDLVTWWLDAEPVEVYARGHKQTSGAISIFDYLEMTLTFANGASALCEMSRAHRIGNHNQRELLVLGTEGIIEQEVDDEALSLIADGDSQSIPVQVRDGFVIQLQAWLGAIAGQEAEMTSNDAVRAVALGVAVEQSIATGTAVSLDRMLAGEVAT